MFEQIYTEGEISKWTNQGRRQVKICEVDRHGEGGARAYNGGLEAERPPSHPSSNLYQFQERPLAKVGWTCATQSTPWRRHWNELSKRIN